MRKLVSWMLILAVLMSMLCVPALAANDPEHVEARVTYAYGRNIVTVKLWAMEDTTNGHIKVRYDADVLTLLSADVEGTVTAVDDDTAGVVELGYADLEPIKAEGLLAALEFGYERNESTPYTTEIWVGVESFNGEEELDESTTLTVRLKLGVEAIGGGSAQEPEEEEPEGLPFIDVHEKDWFYDAVEYAVRNGYFNGTSATTFSPNEPMTRAMFVTVLGRMAGVKVDNNTSAGFDDVVAGSYYAGYVQWASENGIVNGTSETTFSPNDYVTREQMAAFLYRYAEYMGLNVTASDSVMNSFADAGSVSGWAKDAMAWATFKGIINGTGSGLEPKASATRAQVAQIILNFQTKA